MLIHELLEYDISHGWASEEWLTQKGTSHESFGYVKCFFASCQRNSHFFGGKKGFSGETFLLKSFLLSTSPSAQAVRGVDSLLEAVGLFLIHSEVCYWLRNTYNIEYRYRLIEYNKTDLWKKKN